jgi:hypothetical protein
VCLLGAHSTTPAIYPAIFHRFHGALTFGPELIDVSQRAAMQAISPYLQQLQHENTELRARHAKAARRVLGSQVEAAIPDYREFDRDPRWHQWLLGIDLMSGRVRQQLLNEAIDGGKPRESCRFSGNSSDMSAPV